MAPGSEEQRHLVFACPSGWFAVPEEVSAEVVPLPALTPVPGARPHLLGVFSHRGEIIPVVELAHLFGEGTPCGGKRAVLLRAASGALALMVQSVVGLVPLTVTPAADAPAPYLHGTAERDGHAVRVLDVSALLAFLARP